MSKQHHAPRRRLIVAATSLALAAVAPLSLHATERLNLGGLQSGDTHDRFIVKYRDGAAAQVDTAAIDASLRAVAGKLTVSGGGKQLRVEHLRRMAQGADVVRTSRKLDRADAESLMRQIAADPNVEFVEVDRLNQVFWTPNDPRFSSQYGFGTGAGGIRATTAWDTTRGAGAVPATPMPLLVTAATVPATCVPCQLDARPL